MPAFVPPTMRPCMGSMYPVPHPAVVGSGGNGGPGCGIGGGGVTTLHCLTKHVYLRFANTRFSRILGFVRDYRLKDIGVGDGRFTVVANPTSILFIQVKQDID